MVLAGARVAQVEHAPPRVPGPRRNQMRNRAGSVLFVPRRRLLAIDCARNAAVCTGSRWVLVGAMRCPVLTVRMLLCYVPTNLLHGAWS
eukprot:2472850-Rhodomonas_salina.5